MEVNKKEGKILNEAIKEWERRKLISSEEAERLSRSFTVINFDWGLLAKYSFWIAIVCAVIAFLSLVVDDVFIGLVELIVSTDLGAIIFFSGIASVFYYWGSLRRKTRPEKIFSNETILFAGAFFTAVFFDAFDAGVTDFLLTLFFAFVSFAAFFVGAFFTVFFVVFFTGGFFAAAFFTAFFAAAFFAAAFFTAFFAGVFFTAFFAAFFFEGFFLSAKLLPAAYTSLHLILTTIIIIITWLYMIRAYIHNVFLNGSV